MLDARLAQKPCERVALNLKVDAEYFGNVVPHAKCSLSFFS